MCGIVGITTNGNAIEILFPTLQRLEYRGYDSAGVAVLADGNIKIVKKQGKISDLISEVAKSNFPRYAKVVIGHTRWATHGAPSDENAHPHSDCKSKIAVVHNGIIENYLELKRRLIPKHNFRSETDTEVIAHLIEENLELGSGDFESAFLNSVSQLEGAFAIAAITSYASGKIMCARRKAPLVIGMLNSGFVVSSDVPSLIPITDKIVPLEDGEIAIIEPNNFTIRKGEVLVKREAVSIALDVQKAEKGGYKYFMQKEIFEQPKVVEDTISAFLSQWDEIAFPPYKKIIVTACGTSYHAGLLGKLWLETIAKENVEVDYASELRYKDKDFSDSLVVAISQSGETADTLESVRIAKEGGAKLVAVVNILGSTLSREADIVLHTNAGPEIGVAATKTFISQLTVLFLLSLKLGGLRKDSHLVSELRRISEKIDKVLRKADSIESVAKEVAEFRNALYLGRWVSFPVSLEGALKLKEIAYIHAEAYPSGEMKHGPLALVSPEMVAVFVMPKDRVFKKNISNLKEVTARGGKAISVVTEGMDKEVEGSWRVLQTPETLEILTPFVTTPVLQLLAYYAADYLGYNIDQPRNLAKSVTVE